MGLSFYDGALLNTHMFIGMLYTLLFALSFIVVLSALVFFHELGHYSVARFFKVSVERFSIGFGKPLMKWTARSGTEWTVNAIPLGGYVKFLGDAGAASNPDSAHLEKIKKELAQSSGVAIEDCFHFKPLWQRTLIVLAGPLANFILAILIFAGFALAIGTQDFRSVVVDVQTGSAAEAAGVQEGDRFLRLNDKDVSMANDLISYVAIRSDVDMTAEVERAGQVVSFPITPKRTVRRDFINGQNTMGTLGVRIGGEDALITKKYGPIQSLIYGTVEVGRTISTTGTYIGRIFAGKEDGKALGGVVRIATMTGKTAVDTAKLDITVGERVKVLFMRLLSLAAALSVGLGVANLMPIPVLDGGHLLYYGYEAVAGRPLDERKQELGFRIGFALLLTLLVVLTFNDISYIRSLFS